MPTDASSKVPLCHACHAELRAGDETCWLCGAAVTSDAAEIVATHQAGVSAKKASRAASFSLATLMMFMTLAAVIFGIISIAPGVGIALALLLVPVLVHTTISVRNEKALGRSPRPGEQVMLFFGSLGLVVTA